MGEVWRDCRDGLHRRSAQDRKSKQKTAYEVEKAADIMRKLSCMGVQISIDDFGTGYSSLAYLKHLPVHTLKMDKSFVDHVADDEEDAAFAKMVIGIAKSLHLELIAEGVETAEQLDFLRTEGCRHIQGFYFSQPLTPEDALEYMKAHYAGTVASAVEKV